jgi:hypothetical protein
MNKGDRFTVVVLGYVRKLPDTGFRPSAPFVNTDFIGTGYANILTR